MGRCNIVVHVLDLHDVFVIVIVNQGLTSVSLAMSSSNGEFQDISTSGTARASLLASVELDTVTRSAPLAVYPGFQKWVSDSRSFPMEALRWKRGTA
jgi:hypothetical protein